MTELFFVPTYSLLKIPDNFGWGVLTGLITTLVLFIARWLWRGIRNLLKMYQRFTPPAGTRFGFRGHEPMLRV